MIKITVKPANRLCKGAHRDGPSHCEHYRHGGLLFQGEKLLLDLSFAMNVKFAYESRGLLSQTLSLFLYCEKTRNISTPPWMGG